MASGFWRFLFILTAVFLGLLACKPERLQQLEAAFPVTASWLREHQAAITCGLPGQATDMEQAFRQGYILAYGEGLPKQDSDHAGQRRLTAQRAAEVVAQRNLAAFLSDNGAYTTARFDTFSTATTVPLRGFEVVSREFNSEQNKAVVLIKYDLQRATRLLR